MRKGRSVYEQPGTKVDRVASRQKEGFQVSKGDKGKLMGNSKGSKKGNCAITYITNCICVYNNCLNV
jgi:hypothetical protein